MFPTLMAKTFFILSLSLALCYVGAQLVVNYFRRAYQRGEKFVTAKLTKVREYNKTHFFPEFDFFPW